jgi:glycosyltransferase involved in cell wall biosynthesis
VTEGAQGGGPIGAASITCVIPAFENPALFGPCLASVIAQRGVALEIIVTDDSASGAVREIAAAHPQVRYVAGPRSGNPVENWNHGLALAGGEVCVLVHHDDTLADPDYLARAAAALTDPGVAAAIGPVAVTGVRRPSRHRHAVRLARGLGYPLWLLPAMNWIGPTASFVFRRGPLFDARLKQLVDVEFYRRVAKGGRLAILEGVCVASLGHHDAQISATIDPRAEALRDVATLAKGGAR